MLLGLAVLFGGAATLYSALWIYYARWEPAAQLGIQSEYSILARSLHVTRVAAGSAAERAGLRPGDGIVAVNDRPLEYMTPFWDAVTRGRPGDRVKLAVNRQGAAAPSSASALALQAPLTVEAVLDPRPPPAVRRNRAEALFWTLLLLYPAYFLVVALAVLFLRLEDPNAWLLALLFGGFIAGPPLLIMEGIIHPDLRGFMLAYAFVIGGVSPAVFYWFFAVFPVASPLDRRLPWLKRVLLVGMLAVGVPLGLWLLSEGSSRPLLLLSGPRAEWHFGAGGVVLLAYRLGVPSALLGSMTLAAFGLGLTSLVWNGLTAPTAEARRKIRVIVWGTVVGLTPFLLLAVASAYTHKPYYLFPQWVYIPPIVLSLLLPLSMAYAVVRHRVLEIPTLLRLGLQYALARGVLVWVAPGVAALLVLDLILHGDQTVAAVLRERGWAYALLGVMALVARQRRQAWLEALDRRFFRERYDAQRLLREVMEEARQAGSFERLAPRAVAKIETALHPEFAALLVRAPGETAYRTIAAAPAGQAPPALPADSKLVGMVRLLGKPVPLGESGWLKQQLPHEETEFLRQARIELLTPIAMVSQRTEALLALGPKRSEEPYTREDQDLLAAVATSLALLLDKPEAVPEVVPSSASALALQAPPARAQEAFKECPQCGSCYDTGERCAAESAALVPVGMPRLLAGRYRLERRLGRGGMGAVYEALDTALERHVAVKVLREELVANPEAAERFRREARVAAGFTHPNVVTVHDFGVAAGSRAFLVMERLHGLTLREELQREKRLPADRVLAVLRGVCAAVDAAHQRALIHRDLKPENIFLVRSETPDLAKVLDFGVAKFVSSDAAQATADTATGVLVGTLRYMSPEQLRGKPMQPGWDLWALAIVAYEMLVGAQPFPVATAAEWHGALLAGRFAPVTEHLPAAPSSWQKFFEGAFALDPSNRPDSARSFFHELERVLS